jgi:hypothetical protein
MQVDLIRISRIKPAAYNPRKNLQPGDPEYERLKVSLDHWDLVEPLVWNRKTGSCYPGGGRTWSWILTSVGRPPLTSIVRVTEPWPARLSFTR